MLQINSSYISGLFTSGYLRVTSSRCQTERTCTALELQRHKQPQCLGMITKRVRNQLSQEIQVHTIIYVIMQMKYALTVCVRSLLPLLLGRLGSEPADQRQPNCSPGSLGEWTFFSKVTSYYVCPLNTKPPCLFYFLLNRAEIKKGTYAGCQSSCQHLSF